MFGFTSTGSKPVFGWSPQRLHIGELFGGLMMYFARGCSQRIRGRPFHTGKLMFLIQIPIGVYIGRTCELKMIEYNQNTQAMLEDYVRLHPEEFAVPGHKPTYGDILKTWYPVR